MTPKSVADELLEVLQAHRQNRLQPPPPTAWIDQPPEVQWQSEQEDDLNKSGESP